jgi:PAS domain S-box-containing protein
MRGRQAKIRRTGARAGERATRATRAAKHAPLRLVVGEEASRGAAQADLLGKPAVPRRDASRAALVRRFESTPDATRLEDVLLHWIRTGAEILGAVGGVAELKLSDEPHRVARVHAGIEAPLADTILGIAPDARSAREPREVGELLVAPLLERAGIASIVTLPLATDSMGEVGSIRFLLREEPGNPRATRALLAALGRRVRGRLEARLLTEKFRAVSGRLDQILEGAAEAIIDVDASGVVVGANPHAATIFGISPQGLRGLPAQQILPEWRSACEGASSRGGTQPWREMAGVRADGSPFTAEVVSAPATRLGGWTLFAHDASQRRKRETEGRQSERVASVATLASGLGHDLNNTLLPVRAHLNALLRIVEDGMRERARPHLSAIRDGLDYLQQLADALHFLATDSDHGCEVAESASDDAAATDLHGWWRDAGPLLRGVVAPPGALEVLVPEALPPVAMRIDALTRAALNILTNAAESMPRGRDPALARVRISARAADGAGSVVLEVADNGSGMPPAVERRIFDPFFTTKIRGLGSGLGLPIARRLIEAAGGRIAVETAPGKGTVVRIELPVAREFSRHRPLASAAAHARCGSKEEVNRNAVNHMVENKE